MTAHDVMAAWSFCNASYFLRLVFSGVRHPTTLVYCTLQSFPFRYVCFSSSHQWSPTPFQYTDDLPGPKVELYFTEPCSHTVNNVLRHFCDFW